MQIKSVKDADVSGKRVVVRCDLDVLEGDKVVDARLLAAVPTLQLLHERGATQIIVIGHAGRPGGKEVDTLRIAPIAARLKELAAPVNIEVRENLRFDPREEANDEAFAKELASLGDIFVNESFANSHRVHASIVGIPKFLPSYAGLRFIEEIEKLSEALTPPPGALAIIGGAKFETKQPLIEKLIPHYAKILLGGALGTDVIKARGLPVGASLVSSVPANVDIAGDDKLAVATDAVMEIVGTKESRTGLVVDIRMHERIVDVGPVTAAAWAQIAEDAPFILWNGPLGVYEEGYAAATDLVAQAVSRTAGRAVVGGGDTNAALGKYSFDAAKVFVSTGGGAMLDFLTAGTLPGIEALKNQK